MYFLVAQASALKRPFITGALTAKIDTTFGEASEQLDINRKQLFELTASRCAHTEARAT